MDIIIALITLLIVIIVYYKIKQKTYWNSTIYNFLAINKNKILDNAKNNRRIYWSIEQENEWKYIWNPTNQTKTPIYKPSFLKFIANIVLVFYIWVKICDIIISSLNIPITITNTEIYKEVKGILFITPISYIIVIILNYLIMKYDFHKNSFQKQLEYNNKQIIENANKEIFLGTNVKIHGIRNWLYKNILNYIMYLILQLVLVNITTIIICVTIYIFLLK